MNRSAAVRTLATMLESERARADVRRWIPPEAWPEEAALRIAASLMGDDLKPASPAVAERELAWWREIARCRIDGDAIAEMLAEREAVFLFGQELALLAERLMSGKVGTVREALQEALDIARAVRDLDLTTTARLTADWPGDGDRRQSATGGGSWGWTRSEVAA